VISLRVRVAIAAAATAALLLAGGGWLVAQRIGRELEADFEAGLLLRLRAAATGVEFEHGGIEIHGQGPDAAGFVLRDPDGALQAGDTWMQAPAMPPQPGIVRFALVDAPDGVRCLSAWMVIAPEADIGSRGGLLVAGLAMPIAEAQARRERIQGIILAGGVGLAGISAICLALILGRMLAPHAQLAAAVAQLDPRRPGGRIDAARLPAELGAIASRINELCDRLERAYGLASSIHAAAAHELRTPLAGLRATIEVAQAGGDRAAALDTCLGIALQMQARVDNLLMAARIDAGQMVPRREEVDAHAILRSAWEAVAGRAAARGLDCAWELSGSGIAIGDPEALRMVCSNLLDNAVSHAAGGPLRIACDEAGDRLRIAIANPAVIADADASRVFERGFRACEGAPDVRHAGLGLGIARELVGLMGGRLGARAAGGMFTVEASIPAPGVFEYW
jgi:signal transduction histidine kinase